MPAGSWFFSVLVLAVSAHPKIHYNVIGSPLTFLGPAEAEHIGLPKTQALEPMGALARGASELWFCRHPAEAPAQFHGVFTGHRVA